MCEDLHLGQPLVISVWAGVRGGVAVITGLGCKEGWSKAQSRMCSRDGVVNEDTFKWEIELVHTVQVYKCLT